MERQLLCSILFCQLIFLSEPSPSSEIPCVLIDVGYDCSGHSLQSIPDQLPSSVQILDFSFNFLPSIYNSTFARLKSLVHLDLTRCGINWIYEDVLQNQKNLETLILTGNQIVFLAMNSFNGPLALKHLVLGQTSVKDLKRLKSDDLNSLETLDLSDNSISTLDNLNNFIWYKMKTLNFQMNDIHNISAPEVSALKYSRGLDLSFKGNRIVHIEPRAFESYDFNSLDFSGCFDGETISTILSGLSGVRTNILKLAVYEESAKTYITSDSLHGLCSISVTELDFQMLHFPDLSSATFACLTGLRKLNLRRAHLELLPSAITNMGNLTHLFLDENDFRNVCDVNAHNFPSLTHLSMKGSRHELLFQDSCLRNLSELKFLDLSHGRLDTGSYCCEKQLDGLANLLYLNLSYNMAISWSSVPFRTTPQLKLLDCSQLKFSYDSSNQGPFSNLPHLQALNLSKSNLNLSDPRLLEGLQGLRHLTLTGNIFNKGVISDAEMFKHVPLLETLIISKCGITAIGDDVFHNLTRLTYADLSDNHLGTVSTSAFFSLRNIQLNFARNKITIVDVERVAGLEGTSKIDLSYNPLVCNCSNIKFIDWSQSQQDKVIFLEAP
ncbi:hypothetical protein AGOR_G00014730 [Albula goreensis]|uniref:Disease resistance R13L4/SHOC-2-like LRR domain-containing protein n=1 Tax=Albula goreensis TaxID=1534307 RepID=A0A8T3EBP8_9TELE|nr:hypothetical protein AGOR_G00014730 [Albula goreensis]